MSVVAFDRLSIILTFAAFVFIYTYRIYRRSTIAGKSAIIKILYFSGLTLVPSAAKLGFVPEWMQVPLIVGPQYYGAFFAYLAIDQIINNKFYQPIIRNRLFPGVVVLHVITLLFGYLVDNIQIDFVDTGLFPHNNVYYAFVLFDYFTMLYITSHIAILCWRSLRGRKSETGFGIRCFLFMVCCLMGVFSFALVEINLVLSVLSNDRYHGYLNQMYHSFRVGACIFLLLSFFLPRYSVDKLAGIVNTYSIRKQKRQTEWLSYLHERVSRIVPSVVLMYGDLHIEDLLIEIADALMLIRSYNTSTVRLSAEMEANELFHLLKNNVVIQEVGENAPPPADYHEMNYTIALAKHLRKLEEQS